MEWVLIVIASLIFITAKVNEIKMMRRYERSLKKIESHEKELKHQVSLYAQKVRAIDSQALIENIKRHYH